MSFLPFARTILNSLKQKAATNAYPFEPMPKDPLVRGHVAIDIGVCIFCGLCGRKCPTHAITVTKESKEWEIARFQCIVCGACTEICPKKCLHMYPELTAASDTLFKDKVTADA